jgi:hypothetical protein
MVYLLRFPGGLTPGVSELADYFLMENWPGLPDLQ